MVNWRIAFLVGVGIFAFAAPSSADSIVATGLCSCNVSTPGFSCHFQRWLEAPDYYRLEGQCSAQTNNYGVMSREQTIEKRRKKIHN